MMWSESAESPVPTLWSAVMPVPGLDTGIVAGIHVFLPGFSKQDEDGRDKPGQAQP